jgi:metal-dependent hydrolase (beta-lactamase superfamily II)
MTNSRPRDCAQVERTHIPRIDSQLLFGNFDRSGVGGGSRGLMSNVKGTLELRELTLAIESPLGLVLVVACSHPGVEEILSAASVVDSHVIMVLGGLHLVKTPDPEVERLAIALHDKWKIERIAPGHCTGEATFARLKQVFGPSYRYAGLGSHVDIPQKLFRLRVYFSR